MAKKKQKPRSRVDPKHEIFCREWVIHHNGTKAAISAGYSEATAGAAASRLLTYVKIKARIDVLEKERIERLRLDADQILDEARKLALSDVTLIFDDEGALKPMNEWPLEMRRAVAGVEIEELFEMVPDGAGGMKREHVGYTKKIKLWDKNKAIEMLGRNKKLFTDKIEHKGGITIIVDENGIGPPEDDEEA